MRAGTHKGFRISEVAVGQPPQATGSFRLMFWCPGCHALHGYVLGKPSHPGGPCWSFDGNLEAPSLTPSLFMNAGMGNPVQPVCHLYLTAGKLHFIGDCTHALAGQTVDLPPLPDWLRD